MGHTYAVVPVVVEIGSNSAKEIDRAYRVVANAVRNSGGAYYGLHTTEHAREHLFEEPIDPETHDALAIRVITVNV